eukprot:TRINITY_DN9596_c0_g1_i1.p3 TRINITY_DN9596_c0_g1~~TRINITY_DN9596_c0_g1_i1.p3  ORF type:complete len:147 (-),score=19.96 TRINITY_DN9596_c0_g1_i1:320-697(-)
MPLPVPLPFPTIFCPTVASAGDKVESETAPEPAGKDSATEQRPRLRKQDAPATCPVLTRLVATSGVGAVLSQHANVLKGSLRSGPGKACLDAWALERDDVLELRECLMDQAARYPVFDDDTDDDD